MYIVYTLSLLFKKKRKRKIVRNKIFCKREGEAAETAEQEAAEGRKKGRGGWVAMPEALRLARRLALWL